MLQTYFEPVSHATAKMGSTLCLNDGLFGPGVHGCRDDFDFTQKFERIFLSIIPAAVFVALALTRVVVLSQQPVVVGGLHFQCLKLGFVATYSIIQFSLIILLVAGASGVVHGLSIAGASLAFISSLFLVVLSFLEHARAKRPSTLLSLYILITLLFDIVQARTAWLTINTSEQTTLARLFTCSIAVKVVVLCLEAVPKTRWIKWKAEEHSPEESSSIFSLGVFFWLNTLFMRGYRDVLGLDNLYPLDNSMLAQKLYNKLETKLRMQRWYGDPKFGLLKDLCRALPGPLLTPVAPRVALIAFKFCQPFFIDATLGYLSRSDSSASKNHGYGLIGACVLIYTGIAVSSALYNYWNQRAVYTARGCLAAAIYRKTTETKLSAADDSAAITLMSTDIERIIKGGQYIHDMWACIIEVAIGCWLLENKIGVAFISPFIVIVICAGALTWLIANVGRKQAEWMTKIQNRVGLTSNAISHMKLYKISGITAPVAELIQSLRAGEIKIGNQFRWMLILAALLGYAPLCFAPVVTFAVTSSKLDVNTLFTSMSYIILLTAPLTSMFQNLPTVFAALACIRRIQTFLLAEPRVDFRSQRFGPPSRLEYSQRTSAETAREIPELPAFTVKNGSFGWTCDKMVLNNVNTSIPASKLTLVVGPVASGKSTFCKVLLGEAPLSSGEVITYFPSSQIGYCEQTPFLYNATFQENIIGHCPLNQRKYDEIIDATMLGPDISLLPQGHDTKIGSNGIMLSGGQRQRVSVARALYSEADVMIFDDILSGLDNDTEAELFRRVFGPQGITRRRHTTVVICTHSVRNLPSADHIVALGADGTVVEEGTFQDLMNNNKYVQSLGVRDGPRQSDEPEQEQETTASPKSQVLASKRTLGDKGRMQSDWTIYKHYLSSVRLWSPILLVFTGLMYGFCSNFSTIWLKFWADNTFERHNSFYAGVFGLLKVGQVMFLAGNATITLIVMISFSGNILHRRAIMTVVSAPLKFFTITDSGIVTNLFSQDMTLLDGDLPSAMTNVTLDIADTFGVAFVIASASPYLAIGYPFLFGVLYFLQKFYLRTSRQLRLLDLEAKSPLYTHFIDTIKGVATIRAFGWKNADIQQNDQLIDDSQRPAYLLGMIQQWLMSTLQLIAAGLAVLLIGLATQLRANTGLTGASLVTLLAFTEVVSSLIRNYTLLETSMGAVSRLRTFSETVKPEDQPGEDLEPPESWPQDGRIDIRGVSASYGTDHDAADDSGIGSPSNLVLRDLELAIKPRQKVAICGRTGSGKSSLILLLLRLLDPLPSCASNMEIDGIPCHRLVRSTLRKRIIAIPQDAVFLPDGSTVKANIDPLEAATQEECLSVLQLVRLSSFVDDRGSLDAGMSADDLSAGQKQLFSLARAILRKRVRDRTVGGDHLGGLLLLDEVSSSVDKDTDRAMQEMIRQEFESYTIVMVSHRLEMVMDFFDRVIVLDKGSVVESGSPKELVSTSGSRFGELWALGNHEKSS